MRRLLLGFSVVIFSMGVSHVRANENCTNPTSSTLVATRNLAQVASALRDPYTGVYSQNVEIGDLDNVDPDSCAKAGHRWKPGTCLETDQNTVSISKLDDVPDMYYVHIETTYMTGNFCEFSKEMKNTPAGLVYKSPRGACTVRIHKTSTGLIVDDHACPKTYAGCPDAPAASLNGTGMPFVRSSDADDLNRSDEPRD
jgi:hypothetical protein